MKAGADLGRGSDKTAVTITANASVFDPREAAATVQRLMAEHDKRSAPQRDAALREMVAALGRAELPFEVEGDYVRVDAPGLMCWRMGVTNDGQWQVTHDEKLPTAEAAAKVIAWAKNKQAEQAKGAQTMTTAQQLVATAKLDASEAAWRTAGSQFVKLAREPLVGLLTRHLAPNDDAFRARLAAFLETELGTALLASMLSATLSALPQTTGEVPQKLARELRVKAMATAGDELAGVLMDPLLQVMRLYLQDPQGAPAAVHALDAPQSTGVEFASTTQREGVR